MIWRPDSTSIFKDGANKCIVAVALIVGGHFTKLCCNRLRTEFALAEIVLTCCVHFRFLSITMPRYLVWLTCGINVATLHGMPSTTQALEPCAANPPGAGI